MLSHDRRCQLEAACRTPLDVALGESSGIGESAVVEVIEGVRIVRLHRELVFGQIKSPDTIYFSPAAKVLGILEGKVEAKALALRGDVQFVVVVLAQQLGRIERCTERNTHIADGQANR